MAGNPNTRAAEFQRIKNLNAEKHLLGLPVTCGTVEPFSGFACDKPPVVGHIRCGNHKYDIPTVRGAQALAKQMREEMAAHLLPKSYAVMDDVLTREAEVWEDPETGTPVVLREAPSDNARLRAAAMVMDRVGLTPGTDIHLTGEVRVVPPMEKLAEAMRGIAERMGLAEPDTVPGEVIAESSVSVQQPEPGPGATIARLDASGGLSDV